MINHALQNEVLEEYKSFPMYVNKDKKIFDIKEREYCYIIWSYDRVTLARYCLHNKIDQKYFHNEKFIFYIQVPLALMRKIAKRCIVAEKYDKMEFDAYRRGEFHRIKHITRLRDTRFIT